MPSIAQISINVTDADSPGGVRRRIHLRSLSDVTPASRAATPRARSHSERPRAEPARSPARAPASPAPAPAAPRSPAAPVRFVRSERSSPDASLLALEEAFAASDAGLARRPHARDRSVSDVVSVLGNPWRKMSEVDLSARPGARAGLDPWVRNPTLRADSLTERPAPRDDAGRAASDSEQKREAAPVKRGKLERKSPVACDKCGDDSCSCWRAGWARQARAARSLGAQCTCEARSPRPSPARLAPRARAADDAEAERAPRRLYKSASQRAVGEERVKPDPLLETTC